MRRLAVGLLLAAWVGVAVAGDIWVRVVEPRQGEEAAGDVDFVADVVAEKDVAEVEFRLDDRVVGVSTGEPYRTRVSIEDPEREHRFTVVARDVSGAEATDTVVTAPLALGTEYEVQLQQLYVTVSAGEQGPRVLDLDRDDFTIVDDGDRQQLVTFARGDIPFTATLLIDASASMYGAKLEAATEGARSFVRGMAPLDQAKVMAFSHRILSESPFTDSGDVLAGALSGTQAWGGTAINDHLYLAIKTLEARQGRRVVVLLSDGVDSHSALTMEQVQEQARRGQTLLYWLRLTRPGDVMAPDAKGVRLTSAWRTADEYRRQLELLVETVEESGGRIVPVQSLDEIRPAFAEILRELREQYVLGYYPTSSRDDGSWHRVRVSVARPGVEVRAHRGYIDL